MKMCAKNFIGYLGSRFAEKGKDATDEVEQNVDILGSFKLNDVGFRDGIRISSDSDLSEFRSELTKAVWWHFYNPRKENGSVDNLDSEIFGTEPLKALQETNSESDQIFLIYAMPPEEEVEGENECEKLDCCLKKIVISDL